MKLSVGRLNEHCIKSENIHTPNTDGILEFQRHGFFFWLVI